MKNQEQFVSVIIPTLNSKKTIKKCLTSWINQDYKNYEIILVDGGSINGTKKIIENFHKKYKKKIKRFVIENCGISKARNIGVKKSKGNIVIFTDADAVPPRNLLRKINKLLLKNPHIMILSGGKKTLNKGSDLARFIGYRLETIYEYVTKKNIPYVAGNLCICRKKIFHKITFDERFRKPSNETLKFGYEAFKLIGKNKIKFDPSLRIGHINPTHISEFYRTFVRKTYGNLWIFYERYKHKRLFFKIFLRLFISLLTFVEIAFTFFPPPIKNDESIIFILKSCIYTFIESVGELNALLLFLYDSFLGNFRF